MDSSSPAARLARQIEFIFEVDQLKEIFRQTINTRSRRAENDAEHSWHLCLCIIVLAEHANHPSLDVLRVLKMLIIHDLVEIDAGDTFAYDQGADAASKAAREQAAADRLFGLLPPTAGAYLRELWDEYERGDTPEARYVMAIDRMAPMLLNIAEGGTTWREHGITTERVIDRNGPHIEPAMPHVWAEALARLRALPPEAID